jgi:hypothetical protein
MPPDGGGKGHFTSMAEIRTALLDHDRRLALLERALYSALTDVAVKAAKKRRPKPSDR